MLDLSSTDVWPSTLQKIGMWAKQPSVREGYLTPFDAACLMSEHGYGGIYLDCSRATQDEIIGLKEALELAIDDQNALEGYPPNNRFVNGEYQDVYPLIAYRLWVKRTGYGDGRYFENTDTKSEKDVALGAASCSASVVDGASEPPFGVCASDMAETVEVQFEGDELLAEVIEQRGPTFTIQQAVINMFGLDKDREYFDDFDQQYRFTGVPDACESAMLQSVNRQKELVTFMGYECVNPFDVMDNYKVTFPREAYYQWWNANPHGMPCPEWFEDLRKDDEARLLDEAEGVEVASFVGVNEASTVVLTGNRCDEDIEVVEGITVKDLRDMLEADKPTYCPRLLASIKTKKDLMPRETTTLKVETVYGRYAKTESVHYLKQLGVVNAKDKSKNPEPADLDINAVARILCRTHKKDEGRPKNY